ncbi:MAG: vitamin B12 dependent methionine synthase [Eggerthellaceae bacterium]|nr:vitamin B12 dependent methionine synthase [Eggerthellaceae bacterium]
MRLAARVDVSEALGYLGHAGQELSPDLARRLDRAVELAQACDPQGVARAFPVAALERDAQGMPCAVRLEGTPLVLSGYDVARHLSGAREVVLMAVTLGLASEQTLRREQALSPTDGLLLDACASALAESAANELSRVVALRAAERGLTAGARFSPGYGDLPLDVQRALLDALDATRALGVTVTPGNLLVPSKSITAVAGLFAEGGKDAEAAESAESAEAAEDVRAVGGTSASPARTCAVCHLAPTCILHAQGRTCYGR